MTSYTATFADGSTKTLKASKREYSHAWRMTWTIQYRGAPFQQSMSGFAASEVLAQKALAAAVSRYGKSGTDSAEVVEAARAA